MSNFSAFELGYMECLEWTECHSDNPEMMHADLSDDARTHCVDACRAFQADNAKTLDFAYACDYSEHRAGFDYWLSRNGHGTGYFDRDELPDDICEALQHAARLTGEVWAYLGDDGEIYVS
jgi:hypothetical protein